jgi:hypothetical protein
LPVSLGLLLSIAGLIAASDDAGSASKETLDGGTIAVQIEAEPCAAERSRLARRKAWLLERHQEQALRGFPDPKAGIPNMEAVYCKDNPKHEECTLGNPPMEFSPDELTWEVQKTFEDRDPHAIGMKRALDACRQRNRAWR